jgi:LysM repeat protein
MLPEPPGLVPFSRRHFLRRCAFVALALATGRQLGAATGGATIGTHVVRRGETLSSIAADRGLTVAELKQANKLRDNLIRVGQKLKLPGRDPALEAVLAATKGLEIPAGRWTMIVGHHSAIARGNARTYDRAHRERGMENGLAYHFVIGNGLDSSDGQIEVGPRWKQQLDGGHVRDDHINHIGIGICCVGDFERTRPTARQIASFETLVSYLRDDLRQGRGQLKVHREIAGAQTLCPGRYFPISAIRRRLAVS